MRNVSLLINAWHSLAALISAMDVGIHAVTGFYHNVLMILLDSSSYILVDDVSSNIFKTVLKVCFFAFRN